MLAKIRKIFLPAASSIVTLGGTKQLPVLHKVQTTHSIQSNIM